MSVRLHAVGSSDFMKPHGCFLGAGYQVDLTFEVTLAYHTQLSQHLE